MKLGAGPFCPFALAAFVLALGATGATGCATRSPQAPEGRVASRGPVSQFDPHKQEIAALWTQIRDWRLEMGLRVEPDSAAIPAVRRQPVRTLRDCPEDPKPRSTTCRDTCNIADAICDNAERICDIADQLPGDAWAAEKCASAKVSCKEATERCCDCVAAEEPGEEP